MNLRDTGTISMKSSRDFPMREGERLLVRDGDGRVVEIWDCTDTRVGKTDSRHTFHTYGYTQNYFL